MDDPRSPVETPTTPATPFFPHISAQTAFRARSTEAISAGSSSSRRPSNISIPSRPLESTIVRPIPTPYSETRPSPMDTTSTATRVLPLSSPHSPLSQGFTIKGAASPAPTPSHHQTHPSHSGPVMSAVLSHLATPLVPLISVTSGEPHSSFPRSLLQYNLLTHTQLDDLALHYHQTNPPCRNTFRYPVAVPGWVDADGNSVGDADLDTKRRRWGRFVGLRGCESPLQSPGERQRLEETMEREWRRALQRQWEEEEMRQKSWRGRW